MPALTAIGGSLGDDRVVTWLYVITPTNLLEEPFQRPTLMLFFRRQSHGPQHLALVTVLADLNQTSGKPLDPEARVEVHAALGQAVVRHWSSLSPQTQHDLFEAAILASGEKRENR